MAANPEALKLVHITTVAESLLSFFPGQVGYMQARGFEVHGLSSPGECLQRFGAQERVPVHGVPMSRRMTPLRDGLAIWRIWRQLRQLRPQIVHSHTAKGGLLGVLGAWLGRVPVRIYHIHGLPLASAAGAKRLVLAWTEKFACKLAHQVLCVSHSVREVVVAAGLCPAEKIKVLLAGSTNGVDASIRFNPAYVGESARAVTRTKYGIPAEALVVGFVGRIVREKGVEELLEAWKAVREQFPALHLLVVGPLEPHDPLPPHVVASLHADSRIHLTGQQQNVPPLYAAMDVVVLPSYREGFGSVLTEAAAMAIPTVATRIPGCVDSVQDGVTGTLVRPRDAGALADAIRMYVSDPLLRCQHGQAGRERALRDFRQEAVWEAVYQEYLRLLLQKGLSAPQPLPDCREKVAFPPLGARLTVGGEQGRL